MRKILLIGLLSLSACCHIDATSHACPVPVNWSPGDQMALKEERELAEGKIVKRQGQEYALYFCDMNEANCVAAEMPQTLRIGREWLNLRDESRICAGS